VNPAVATKLNGDNDVDRRAVIPRASKALSHAEAQEKDGEMVVSAREAALRWSAARGTSASL
jgi:hypothetical protein